MESDIFGGKGGPERIWTRRDFTLNEIPEVTALRMRIEATDGVLYVNGNELTIIPDKTQPPPVSNGLSATYRMLEIPRAMLRKGKNTIAAYAAVSKNIAYVHLDYGVFDTRGLPVELEIVGASQPNVQLGRNGFEVWAVYKAFWNGINGQGKSRIFFFDEEMTSEGPTSKTSPVMSFDSSQPSFIEYFDGPEGLERFEYNRGQVQFSGDSIQFNKANNANIFVKGLRPENLYVEASIKFADKTGGGAAAAGGVIPWQLDAGNYVKVLIKRAANQFVVESCFGGTASSSSFDLPSTFQYMEPDPRTAAYPEQYHTFKVYKNGSKLYAGLDHYWLNSDKPVFEDSRIAGAGAVGFVSQNADLFMDALKVTVGYVDHKNRGGGGWSGGLSSGGEGLICEGSGRSLAFKGDALAGYEFSANLETGRLPSSGGNGLALVHVNEQNHLTVFNSFKDGKYIFEKTVNRITETVAEIGTTRLSPYGHSNHSDSGLKRYDYDLRGETKIDSLKILWTQEYYSYGGITFSSPSKNKLKVEYYNQADGRWEAAAIGYADRGPERFSDLWFNAPVTASKLRLNVPAVGHRPFEFVVNELASSQNFYRVVRTGGTVCFWANNKLVARLDDPFPNQKARAGLAFDGVKTTVNSVTSFEVIQIQASN
jgi:hypothetical protein